MREGWESQARNWARLARTPARAVVRDPGARRWLRIPLFLHLRAVKPG
jgi:hypothetical protein